MKNKILFIVGLSLSLPLISLAKESDISLIPAPEATAATSTIESPKVDNKKDELRKQLTDTINTYSAVVNSLTRLSQRITEREDILTAQNNLSQEAKDNIDAKKRALNDNLTSLNDQINIDLTKEGDLVATSIKPSKKLPGFKKEAYKIKLEIISAHKLLTQIINSVIKESLVAATSTPDQSN
ncbi:MAG: hypothetical protein HY225_01800 [Candidatus Vogelbacteria bacterium]|nr:hypothetical protein [Candidatus Vogelbacteria bacterium]